MTQYNLDILNRNEDEFSLKGILTSAVVAETFERMLFNDLECFVTWDMIKLVMTDKGSEFKGDFEKLLRKHNVKNQKVNSKSIMDQKFGTLNNTITRLIEMTPNKARKKKHVYAKSSKPRNGPMGFDEERLPYGVSVRYLLKPDELEGGKRRGTDCNWSPQTYSIKESLIRKNQPILYWLIDENDNGLKRSFVREELLKISKDSMLPPQWVLKQY
ncbi:hypothetical protein Glove_261g55 [Diversispora epigaea]|uniref:Integrase catalytic domain-containing protein n=1 Tax=Diversispora epigaea TaxID=1348612 RepID=A0A397I6A4_9GLOM|nr:hypothetical protein Glove_261g55 [Diversispora epigaea]